MLLVKQLPVLLWSQLFISPQKSSHLAYNLSWVEVVDGHKSSNALAKDAKKKMKQST